MLQKKFLIIIGAVLSLGVLIFAISFFFFPPEKEGNYTEGEEFVEEEKIGENRTETCNEKGTTFTHDFTDPDLITRVGVLGSITAGSRGRSYVNVKEGQKVPLYAPADTTLEEIYYMHKGYSGASTRPEYRLEFRVNCDVTFFFDHISDVEEKIKSVSPKEPAETSNVGVDVSVEFKAGELIGHTDGTMTAGTWDFSVMSEGADIYHINPDRWTWAQNTKAVCPYDYYIEELKKKYYNLLSHPFGEKSTDCGSPTHDVDGTLSGGWFIGDGSTDTDGNILLVGSAGTAVEISIRRKDVYEAENIRTFDPPKAPKDVKPGESVCYAEQDNGKYAYFTLVDNFTVHVDTETGPCPSSLPSDYEVWER